MKQYLCLTAIAGLVLLGDWPSGQCGDCLDNTGVHVDFPDPPVDENHHGAVLFSGWRDHWCRTDVLCSTSSSVYLGEAKVGSDKFWAGLLCNKFELAAFAPDRAPKILGGAGGFDFPSSEPDWFDAPRQVNVTLWEIDSEAWASHDSDTLTAQAIFANAASGITLNITIPSSPMVALASTNGSYYECDTKPISGGLADGDPSRARQLSPGYDAASINVYYVSSVRYPGQAWTCRDANNPAGAWDVIFIAKTHYPHALAHELGHALGLNRTAIVPTSDLKELFTGDVDELDGGNAFPDGNLMYYGTFNPHSLTIGQIYRMHFDVRSWLNRDKVEVENGYPRTCQDNPLLGGDCPPLPLNPPEGWP